MAGTILSTVPPFREPRYHVLMVRLEAIERLQHNTRRVVEIVSVLVKYGLADWLRAVPLGFVQ